MISAESLQKFVDSSQLTGDLDGSLVYDHDEWIQMRLVCSVHWHSSFSGCFLEIC